MSIMTFGHGATEAEQRYRIKHTQSQKQLPKHCSLPKTRGNSGATSADFLARTADSDRFTAAFLSRLPNSLLRGEVSSMKSRARPEVGNGTEGRFRIRSDMSCSNHKNPISKSAAVTVTNRCEILGHTSSVGSSSNQQDCKER